MKIVKKIQELINHIKTMVYKIVGYKFGRKRYNLIPMRELSESEKYVVKKLVNWDLYLNQRPYDWHNESLASILSDFTKQRNSEFNIDFENKEIKIKVSAITNTELLGVLNKYRRDFITITYFIDYLYGEKLLYVTPLNENADQIPNTISWLEKNFNHQTTELTINDVVLIKTLEKYYCKALIPTEYLVKYYKQECKTDEEIRFKDTMAIANEGVKKARTAIFVAIGIGVASILLTLITLLKPNNDTELILNRIDRLEEKTDRRFIEIENRINIRFDSIDNRLKRVEHVLFVVKPWEQYYDEMENKKKK
jgi:hypothetical protein